MGVSVSMCCRGRDGAHYAWCVTMGGDGRKPGSLEDLAARAKAASKAAHPSSRRAPAKTWGTPPRPGRYVAEEHELPDSVAPERQSTSAGGCRPRAGHLPKELVKPVNAAVDQGWEYEYPGNGRHPRLRRGDRMIVMPGTGGKGSGVQNALAQLRREGIAL